MPNWLGTNFVTGLLLAKDLEQRDRLLVAMSAGQQTDPMGVILLKPVIDRTVELQAKSDQADSSLASAALRTEIEMVKDKSEALTIFLRVPGARSVTWSFESRKGDAKLSQNGLEAKLEIPRGAFDVTISALVDGVRRDIVMKDSGASGEPDLVAASGAVDGSRAPAGPGAPVTPPGSGSPPASSGTPGSSGRGAGSGTG